MPAILKKPVTDSYTELILEFPLRRIKSPADHGRAIRIVLRLSAPKADRGASNYLNVLIDLVADYETRTGLQFDTSIITVAELVRHRMEERGATISSVARTIGIPQSNLSEMLSGKRAWSKAAIRGLSAHLHIRAERFLI